MTNPQWPAIPLGEWRTTKDTLQLWMQIVGKIRLTLTPQLNHWWNVPFYVSARGLTTGPIPHDNRTFEMEFDFIDHNLVIRASDGTVRTLPLIPRPVAEFYSEVMSLLHELGIDVKILARPFGISITEPFATDRVHDSYDAERAHTFWRILVGADAVFKEFRARFIGKCSPVHFFWHSFDLAVTRFSGRKAPEMEGADKVTKEAYSHEVISCGFWAGDDNITEPAFYCYSAPEPAGLADEPLRPEAAFWNTAGNGSMALLKYDDVRARRDPRRAILDFLQSSYEAGAKRAGWEREALERPAAS
ncbi:MAG: DUF5996 family protein [Candidatus Kapaibacterium sp.]